MPGITDRIISLLEDRGDTFRRPVMAEKTKVRRCLFGRPDHSELRKDLDRQLQETNVSKMSKWNYDFSADRPLEGRYEWHAASSTDEYVPEFYKKGYPSRPTKNISVGRTISPKYEMDCTVPSATSPALDSENTENLLGCSRLESNNTCNSVSSNEGHSSSSPRNVRVTRKSKQSRINDFMRQKKRKTCNDYSETVTKSPRREDS